MNIVIRKSDKIVLYVCDHLVLSNNGLTGGKYPASNITSVDHELIEVDNIPSDFVGGWYSYDNGWAKTDQWVSQGPTIDELKAEMFDKINAQFAIETTQIKGTVMQEEIDTFGTQEAEALLYQSDSTAPTPVLSRLVSIRKAVLPDLTVAELAQRVLDHAAAYKDAISQVMGKKHALEDLVKAATTIDDLKNIEVS